MKQYEKKACHLQLLKLTNMFLVEFKIPLLQATDHATAGDKALVNHI